MRRLALIALLAVVSCSEKPDPDRVRLYHTAPIGPGLEEVEVQELEHLGPTLLDKGVNFGVFSANATRVDVLLFDDPESDQPTQQFEMKRTGDVWNLYVEGIGLGQHYGYIAWGPNWEVDEKWSPGKVDGFVADVDAAGHRFNPNKLLIDPYAKALHRDHDWSRGSLASGPDRTVSTYAASSKSVVVQSAYEWSENETTWREQRQDDGPHAAHEQIVYEVHAKGFTADPASGVTHPGTYRGLGDRAEYFADLGVTAVELLPIHEKPLDGGYWGYNNISFFAPEISYAATDDPTEVIDEFKAMVDALHQQNIEVWVDVVYNHTGEGGLWRERIELNDTAFGPGDLTNFDPHEVAGLYSFRGLDNASYYALSADGRTYWNNTGVGNQTRSNNTAMRKLIIDSLRFYVDELHVDGFRFDLAPVLGEKDQFYNEWEVISQTVVQDIADDEVLNKYNTRIVAEPWSLAGFYLGDFPKTEGRHGWSEWNAHFRDVWRSFVNDDQRALSAADGGVDIGGTLTGSSALFGDDGRRPYHSHNFITVHDGFTLYDLVSYNEKLNGCGPLNPVCCDAPNSPWCQKQTGEDNNRSRDWGDEPTKRQMMRNFFVSMLISHGTPLLLGGDEWMRSQLGNNNAYSTQADNEFNWFQWGAWQAKDENHRMHDFVRKMIRFRRDNQHAFAPEDYGSGAPFSWKNAANTAEPDWGSRNLMLHYHDPAAGPELLIALNMQRDPVDFTLPEGRTWSRVVDTQAYFDDTTFLAENADDLRQSYNIDTAEPLLLTEPTYQAMGSSIVIFQAQ
jgi:glycogen operon protein